MLDTNIVLDTFLFADEAARPVLEGLASGRLRWLATPAMRIELERVLTYPKIVTRLAFRELAAADVLADFDRHAEVVETPPKAPLTCGDADDQKFIDLAVARGALLLSKDREVLALRKRLAKMDVQARPTLG
ncbi:MAG: FIG00348512: hypothetical protein [uncultured Ramlibacter sp.]|uniref:PIN domain-containing protein n=1 Tax=uncultured Ramlibacter sp. TaxID=260755 RepID=A0A6J4P6K0_9BURK|nr:MAG: FIG00348512: hypothetical protein [uncultured Ramlibacter sp.]